MENDLIRRSALLEIVEPRLKYLREKNGNYDHYTDGYEECYERIEDAPAVDAVEVVRCGKCQYSEPYIRMDNQTGYYCKHPHNSFTYGTMWERKFTPVKTSTDFCSHGERKKER